MAVYLSSRQHPYARASLPGVDEDVELDCLIDTGFAGGIAIPNDLKDEFNFPSIGRRVWELADGSEIELEILAGRVKFEGVEKEVAVLFIGRREGLVGIEFLKGMRFLLDLKIGKVELS